MRIENVNRASTLYNELASVRATIAQAKGFAKFGKPSRFRLGLISDGGESYICEGPTAEIPVSAEALHNALIEQLYAAEAAIEQDLAALGVEV
jgi:hypothetical protein